MCMWHLEAKYVRYGWVMEWNFQLQMTILGRVRNKRNNEFINSGKSVMEMIIQEAIVYTSTANYSFHSFQTTTNLF